MATISVILATRNRPALFAEALESVLRQSAPPTEIIVIDDGSDEAYGSYYARALDRASARAKHYSLLPRPRGHGAAYARNFGVAKATGDYFCFLDDDDSWEDPRHLERVQSVIAKGGLVDLHMSNQIAVLGGEVQPGPLWIEDLIDILREQGKHPDDDGAFTVTVDQVIRCTGFCHLNTMVVRRRLFEEIGGFDETIRYEEDRDLFLRLIDRAQVMKHSPDFVSRHNIPEPSLNASLATSLSDHERCLSQLRVLDRAVLTASHPSIRAYARRHKAYTLKKITEGLAKEGRNAEAAFYAREALGAGPTWKWAAYTAWRIIQSLA